MVGEAVDYIIETGFDLTYEKYPHKVGSVIFSEVVEMVCDELVEKQGILFLKHFEDIKEED